MLRVSNAKTNKTKPGKPINEYPEKILQLAAYFATYWGEAAIDNPQAWVGNIYISSTERGRTVAIMYNFEAIKRGWEVFKMLCYIWRDRNEYDPRMPVTQQPQWAAPKVIDIAPPLPPNPTTGGITVELATATVPPTTTALSPESPSVQSSQTPQSLPTPSTDEDPTIAILGVVNPESEVDGIKFLNPTTCKNWKKDSVPSIYSWWYHPAENRAKVGFSADGALLEHGWKRCFKAYAADVDMGNRVAGKSDPTVGTNNLPVKPAVVSEPAERTTNVGILKPDTTAAAAAGSAERIAQLERMKMGFGKHKNDTLIAVPTSYFIWCLGEIAAGRFAGTPHVREYLSIDSVVKALDMEAK